MSTVYAEVLYHIAKTNVSDMSNQNAMSSNDLNSSTKDLRNSLIADFLPKPKFPPIDSEAVSPYVLGG